METAKTQFYLIRNSCFSLFLMNSLDFFSEKEREYINFRHGERKNLDTFLLVPIKFSLFVASDRP